MRKKILLITTLIVVTIALLGYFIYQGQFGQPKPSLEKVRFGISPFQDTMVPIVGSKKGWYHEEGLDVEFKILGWTEVMEALSAGHIDVAINNISSVISTHPKNPQLIYWYGFNTFDNGFALMIRPDGKLKALHEIEREVKDHQIAIKIAAAQLKGKTVITTGDTDMEQGVAAAARRGGLNFTDVRIIDLNPDEGLAAFLRGEGDAYIGGIPQRTRATKEGMVEMLTGADLGPPPINGIVTTKDYSTDKQDVMLRLLRVWFKTVNYINNNMEDGASIIIQELNSYSGAQFTIDDFKRFWNNFEHYPSTPRQVQELILEESGSNYWKARWEDTNIYFYHIKHTIANPIDPKDAFLMEKVQKLYVEQYGWD